MEDAHTHLLTLPGDKDASFFGVFDGHGGKLCAYMCVCVGGGGRCVITLCVCHTLSITFWHLPPNSARFSYATEGVLFISMQLSSDTVSALQKVRVCDLAPM